MRFSRLARRGMAGINFASTDALFPAWHDGYRGNGSPGAADAGRGISRLPENDQHVYSPGFARKNTPELPVE